MVAGNDCSRGRGMERRRVTKSLAKLWPNSGLMLLNVILVIFEKFWLKMNDRFVSSLSSIYIFDARGQMVFFLLAFTACCRWGI